MVSQVKMQRKYVSTAPKMEEQEMSAETRAPSRTLRSAQMERKVDRERGDTCAAMEGEGRLLL
jgi:hypothetical protein